MDNSETSIFETGSVTLSNFLSKENRVELIDGIYRGLTQSQKQISSRFFYEAPGFNTR
jgi:uncharacterized SAM-dependent methyltransferase